MYKAPLTASAFKDFSSSYQHFSQPKNTLNSDQPFVYVDASGVKIVTNVVNNEESSVDGVFALSIAHDGWVEMLAIYEAS